MKILRTLPILLFATALLSGCKSEEKQIFVDGQPVYEVPFHQPLTLDPNKEQVFYFKFDESKSNNTNQLIGVATWIPFTDKKLLTLIHEWTADRNDGIVGENTLPFYLSLTHYKDGNSQRITDFRGRQSEFARKLEKKNNDWNIFVLGAYASLPSKIVDGIEYIPFQNSLAVFVPQDKGGYYKVVIKPVAGVDYHNVKMELFVEKEYSGK